MPGRGWTAIAARCGIDGLGLDPVLVAGRLTADFGKTSSCVWHRRRRALPPIYVRQRGYRAVISGAWRAGPWSSGAMPASSPPTDINVAPTSDSPITTLFMPIGTWNRTLGEFLLRRIDGEAGDLRRLYEPAVELKRRLGGAC